MVISEFKFASMQNIWINKPEYFFNRIIMSAIGETFIRTIKINFFCTKCSSEEKITKYWREYGKTITKVNIGNFKCLLTGHLIV